MTTPIYRLLPAITVWWAVSRVTCSGYDEYMTCGTGSERYGRHYHYNPQLPCDLSAHNFCDSPGVQYPWTAVRRFVYENQGLMKRMYGNQRHYSVLRAELINEMFDEMPSRQHHRYRPPGSSTSNSNSRTGRYQKHSNANSLKSKGWRKPEKEIEREGSRAIKITAEPDYHKRNRNTPTTPRSKPQSESSGNTVKAKPMASDEPKEPSRVTEAPTRKTTKSNLRRTQSTTTTPSNIPTTLTAEDILTTIGNEWSSWKEDREDGEEEMDAPHPTVFPPHQLDELDLFEEEFWTTIEDTYSTPTYPPDADSTFFTLPQHEILTSTPDTFPKSGVGPFDDLEMEEDDEYRKDFISTPSDAHSMTTFGFSSTIDDILEAATESYNQERSDADVEFDEALIEEGAENDSAIDNEEQEVYLEDEEDLEVEKREEPPLAQGEVHKDVLEDVKKQETEAEHVPLKRPIRGMNACPVKEEFVAPYWANNTRGETLALLNFYPFEQYVQWERCMYEHRQMYCRKGCRCEQQYRLHKLLAFDPTNECRGIFSDWFRFPSCCVCKCYDLPEQLFTPTARRPRFQHEDDEYEDNDLERDAADDDDDDDDDDGGGISTADAVPYEIDDSRTKHNVQQVRVRGNARLANIPPQRRPRQPPRPISHISVPSQSRYQTPPSRTPLGIMPPRWHNTKATSPAPPEVSTLGTVDTATPIYYYNISKHARLLYGNAKPIPLSRIPRSNPEE